MNQTGSRWKFVVDWNTNFTEFDSATRARFETWCDMWEQDSGDDDLIMRGRHADVAAVGGPMHVTFSNMSSDDLDTELGAEEIYFRCFVRNKDTGQQPSSYSPRVQLGV
ncbi:hypothetical protein OIB37_32940 [Streptomyces sp. NBC_00820]|uniref:hypothetical protein n=1 Tax=Streptomyces sp. NBC_00820 TaxID=2975842 RepID=UPI002ED068E4|nr:hypothetical protein OIB37_32940 [Streptomyces sp. NBC_00820]